MRFRSAGTSGEHFDFVETGIPVKAKAFVHRFFCCEASRIIGDRIFLRSGFLTLPMCKDGGEKRVLRLFKDADARNRYNIDTYSENHAVQPISDMM